MSRTKKTEKTADSGQPPPPQPSDDSPEKDLTAALQAGLEEHQAGQLDEAAEVYKKILDIDPDHADANHLLGLVARQTKNNKKAVRLISKAIKANPNDAAYHTNLGNALKDLGRLEDAAASYRKSIAINPDFPAAHGNLGATLRDLGRSENAVASYRKALALNPDFTEMHSNLGNALTDLGQLEEAAASYREALSLNPDYAEAHTHLGGALMELGRIDDAISHLHKAIAIKPDLAMAHDNLGNAFSEQGRLTDAIACFRNAIAIDPDLAATHTNLGLALMDKGQLEESMASHQKALAIKPDFAEALCNLGATLQNLGRNGEAIANYEQALAINSGLALAHNNIGTILKEQGKLEEAVDRYQKALSINPGLIKAHNNMGAALMKLVELEEAIASYEKALAIAPDNPRTVNSYLQTLLYMPGMENLEIFNIYKRLTDNLQDKETPSGPAPAPSPAADGRLRIGYLSSDFRDHPVGLNVAPLLFNHDHDQFEIFCYSETIKHDDLTTKFQDHADHWRSVIGLTDSQAANLIRDDHIHIMVYLGGHFDGNRPSIAAHRPAPGQVGMHAGSTTAVEEMDFWMTDQYLHPPGLTGADAEQFTEDLFRLPNFYVYPLVENAPPVSPTPAEENGFVTFASFNKPCKMNNTVLDLWSEILKAVPDAHLMLKFRNYLSLPSIKGKFLDRFNTNGISPERINLVSSEDNFHDHLNCYNQVDIALDTFPFAGATTTFQALWMSVPVISLMTERFYRPRRRLLVASYRNRLRCCRNPGGLHRARRYPGWRLTPPQKPKIHLASTGGKFAPL